MEANPMKAYDLIVIGAGPGGYVAALAAAKKGMKVAVVEKETVGGTCLGRGCIPTKTLLHTAELYKGVKEGEEIGLVSEGLSVDMQKLTEYKNKVVGTLSGGIESLFKKAKIALYRGEAVLCGFSSDAEGLHCVRVGEEVIQANKLLIASGSEPFVPPIPGVDLNGVVDSTALLDNTKALSSLVIIGGGVIGMEFASLYAALGTKVTVIEALDKILATIDKEFGQNLKMILKKQGVDIVTGARVTKIEKAEPVSGEAADGGVVSDLLNVIYVEKEQEKQVQGEKVLVAVGRRPALKGLFDDALGQEMLPAMDRKGVIVNEQYETTVPGVYAIGDAIGGIQLAHVASAEGERAIAAMLGEEMPISMEAVPSCVYTSPEIATVGLTMDEAKEKGIEAVQLRYVMSANGKTVLTRQERSFLRIIADKKTGRILGAHMMCDRATDMIGEFSAAIVNGYKADDMGRAIRPHPTYNEAVGEALRTFERED